MANGGEKGKPVDRIGGREVSYQEMEDINRAIDAGDSELSKNIKEKGYTQAVKDFLDKREEMLEVEQPLGNIPDGGDPLNDPMMQARQAKQFSQYGLLPKDAYKGIKGGFMGEYYLDNPRKSFQTSAFSDLAKSLINAGVINTAEGLATMPANLINLSSMLTPHHIDSENGIPWANYVIDTVSDWSDSIKFRTSDASSEFNMGNYIANLIDGGERAEGSFNTHNFMSNLGAGIGSVAAMFYGGKILKAAGIGMNLARKTSRGGKVLKGITDLLASSEAIAMNANVAPGIYRAAKEAGLPPAHRSAFTVTLSPIIGALEKFGIEAAIGRGASGAVIKTFNKNLTKNLKKYAGKELTEDVMADMVKEGAKTFKGVIPKSVKGFARGSAIEGGEEFTQAGAEELYKAMYNELISDTDIVGEGRFDSEFLSAETLGKSLEQAFYGAIIGGGLGTFGASLNKQFHRESMYHYINKFSGDRKVQAKEMLLSEVDNMLRAEEINDRAATKLKEDIELMSKAGEYIPKSIKDHKARFQAYTLIRQKKRLNRELEAREETNKNAEEDLVDANKGEIDEINRRMSVISSGLKQLASTKKPLPKFQETLEDITSLYFGEEGKVENTEEQDTDEYLTPEQEKHKNNLKIIDDAELGDYADMVETMPEDELDALIDDAQNMEENEFVPKWTNYMMSRLKLSTNDGEFEKAASYAQYLKSEINNVIKGKKESTEKPKKAKKSDSDSSDIAVGDEVEFNSGAVNKKGVVSEIGDGKAKIEYKNAKGQTKTISRSLDKIKMPEQEDIQEEVQEEEKGEDKKEGLTEEQSNLENEAQKIGYTSLSHAVNSVKKNVRKEATKEDVTLDEIQRASEKSESIKKNSNKKPKKEDSKKKSEPKKDKGEESKKQEPKEEGIKKDSAKKPKKEEPKKAKKQEPKKEESKKDEPKEPKKVARPETKPKTAKKSSKKKPKRVGSIKIEKKEGIEKGYIEVGDEVMLESEDGGSMISVLVKDLAEGNIFGVTDESGTFRGKPKTIPISGNTVNLNGKKFNVVSVDISEEITETQKKVSVSDKDTFAREYGFKDRNELLSKFNRFLKSEEGTGDLKQSDYQKVMDKDSRLGKLFDEFINRGKAKEAAKKSSELRKKRSSKENPFGKRVKKILDKASKENDTEAETMLKSAYTTFNSIKFKNLSEKDRNNIVKFYENAAKALSQLKGNISIVSGDMKGTMQRAYGMFPEMKDVANIIIKKNKRTKDKPKNSSMKKLNDAIFKRLSDISQQATKITSDTYKVISSTVGVPIRLTGKGTIKNKKELLVAHNVNAIVKSIKENISKTKSGSVIISENYTDALKSFILSGRNFEYFVQSIRNNKKKYDISESDIDLVEKGEINDNTLSAMGAFTWNMISEDNKNRAMPSIEKIYEATKASESTYKPSGEKTILGHYSISDISEDQVHEAVGDQEVFDRIVNRLKTLFPEMKIGNFADYKLGIDKRGVAFIDGFKRVVAWAQESAPIDVAPHEYAHHYIDMFRDTDMIQKGIKKYGEEGLAEIIGSKFAKNMSKEEASERRNFWERVKALFGSSDISEEIYRKFQKGENIRTFENKEYFYDSTVDFVTNNLDMEWNDEQLFKKIGQITKGNIDAKMRKAILDSSEFDNFDQLAFEMAKPIKDASDRKRFNKIIDRARLGLKRYIDTHVEQLKDNENNDISSKILNGIQNQLSDNTNGGRIALSVLQPMVYKKVGIAASIPEFVGFSESKQRKAVKAINTMRLIVRHNNTLRRNSKYLFMQGGYRADVEAVTDIASQEAKIAEDKVESSSVAAKSILNRMKDIVANFNNNKTFTKLMFGNQNTLGYNAIYGNLLSGLTKKMDIDNMSRELFQKAYTEEAANWSLFGSGSKDINNVQTVDIKTQGGGSKKVTKAEMLDMYLILKQDPYFDSLANNGILFDRKGDQVLIKPTEEALNDIISEVESDEAMMNTVEAIREMSKLFQNEISPIYKDLKGINFKAVKNYFPVFYGSSRASYEPTVNYIQNPRYTATRVGSGNKPFRGSDAFQKLHSYSHAMSTYVGFAKSVSDLKKISDNLSKNQDFVSIKGGKKYIEHINKLIRDIENPNLIYGLTDSSIFGINTQKVIHNFSTAVLGFNPYVMAKQPVSFWFVTNKSGISRRHAAKGAATLTRLAAKGVKKWSVTKEGDQVIDEMNKYSPLASNRYMTSGTREVAEMSHASGAALRSVSMSEIAQFFKSGRIRKAVTALQVKSMEGIKVFDQSAIAGLWVSVKEEVKEKFPEIEVGSEEFFRKVVNKHTEIVVDSQPTFDVLHRTDIGKNKDQLVRAITLFSSQRAKNLLMLTDTLNDYVQNPTPENKKALIRTHVNVIFVNAMAISLIDMLRQGIHNPDDEEENNKRFAELSLRVFSTNMGNIYGIGNLSNMVISRVDDEPWKNDMSAPLFDIMNTGADLAASAVSGDVTEFIGDGIDFSAKASGIPVSPKNFIEDFIEQQNKK